MLPASAPLTATPGASQFYSLSKEEEECVFSRLESTDLFHLPEGSSQLSVVRLVSDFFPEIGDVKLSAGLHFMTRSMIIFLPPNERKAYQLPEALLSTSLTDFINWLKNLLLYRSGFLIPISGRITCQKRH